MNDHSVTTTEHATPPCYSQVSLFIADLAIRPPVHSRALYYYYLTFLHAPSFSQKKLLHVKPAYFCQSRFVTTRDLTLRKSPLTKQGMVWYNGAMMIKRIFQFTIVRLVGYIVLGLLVNKLAFYLMEGVAWLLNLGGATKPEIWAVYVVGIAVNAVLFALFGKGIVLVARRVYWKIYMRYNIARGKRIAERLREEWKADPIAEENLGL